MKRLGLLALLVIILSGVLAGCGGSRVKQVLVGLGDSYASGEGLSPYEPDSGKCDRSINSAYPILSGQQLKYTTRNNSCSGATTTTLNNSQLANMGDATVVSVTIGGNDINALGAVLDPPTVDQLTAKFNTLQPRLVSTFQQIHTAAPKARVIAVGYPNIVSATPIAGCFLKSGVVSPLHDALVSLNKTINAAATTANVEYVDGSTLFTGHELCSADPWVNGIDLSNFGASLHPTAQGQAAMAQALTDKIKNK